MKEISNCIPLVSPPCKTPAHVNAENKYTINSDMRQTLSSFFRPVNKRGTTCKASDKPSKKSQTKRYKNSNQQSCKPILCPCLKTFRLRRNRKRIDINVVRLRNRRGNIRSMNAQGFFIAHVALHGCLRHLHPWLFAWYDDSFAAVRTFSHLTSKRFVAFDRLPAFLALEFDVHRFFLSPIRCQIFTISSAHAYHTGCRRFGAEKESGTPSEFLLVADASKNLNEKQEKRARRVITHATHHRPISDPVRRMKESAASRMDRAREGIPLSRYSASPASATLSNVRMISRSFTIMRLFTLSTLFRLVP